MTERYGIIVTLKAKEGKMEELLEISKGHFVRQHDGREPNATCASIVMPLPDEPNTVRFFEQVCSRVLKKNDLWAEEIQIRNIKNAIPVCFCRQLLGRCQLFQSLTLKLFSETEFIFLYLFPFRITHEKWVDEEAYNLHSAPNENLQTFFDKASPLLDGAPVMIQAPMIHYSK